MGVVLTNNVFSMLVLPLTAADLTMTVVPEDADRFPMLGGGVYTYATLSTPGPVNGNIQVEIVKVTGRSGNVLTIVRGRDNTYAQPFPEGSVVALRINAASVMESFITNYDVLLL